MENTEGPENGGTEADDMLAEYHFDYSEVHPNRFADRLGQHRLMVVLDPDVAAVFQTAESVNKVLHALIATMPNMQEVESSG